MMVTTTIIIGSNEEDEENKFNKEANILKTITENPNKSHIVKIYNGVQIL